MRVILAFFSTPNPFSAQRAPYTLLYISKIKDSMVRDNRIHNVPAEQAQDNAQEASQAPSRPLLRIGITHGDTNGVGYELILRSFADTLMFDMCTPIIYGAAKVATYHAKALGIKPNFYFINAAEEAMADRLNLINCFDHEVPVEWGKKTPEAGHAALEALERAVEDLRDGKIDALVTAPICKESMHEAGFKFAGHTEFLAERLGSANQHPLMILQSDVMRVALVTVHCPVSQVAAQLTSEGIEERIREFYASLRRDYLLSTPRIAVLSLNPHCGDGGMLGDEEKNVIAPAVHAAVESGIPCNGPFAPDGFFGAGLFSQFDGILAMYHDQGLIPFKTLSMDSGVNFTAGLSYVRTSPDHGVAFDIAGKGEADLSSFRSAIYAAVDIVRNRQSDDEARQNPLPKLYHERREDSERSRHTLPQPAKSEE